jgi:hypothetical protein
MLSAQESQEWQDLQHELETIARTAEAFNAYVLDAWDNLWCAAHDFAMLPREDLVDLIRVGLGGKAPLYRGGTLDTFLSGQMGQAYMKTYASCYVLLLRFLGPFDHKAARTVVYDALPRLEALTLRLPPLGGPGSSAGEAAKHG